MKLDSNKELELIKIIGDEFINEQLFEKKEDLRDYNKKNLLVGRIKDTDRLYFLDISESLRVFIVGMTRCLSEDTLIETNNGNKKISELNKDDLIKSWDGKKIVYSGFESVLPSQQELFEIELEDGSKIQASAEHRFFMKINEEKKLKDLKEGDEIVTMQDL